MPEELIVFFKESYFVLVYGLTLAIAFITYKKYYDTELKYFPVLIAYTFFNELLGYFIRYNPNFALFEDFLKNTHNDIIYNIYNIFYFGFFYFLYWKLITNQTFKKRIVIAALIAFLTHLVSLFFQNPFEMNLFYATAFSSWALVFCIVLYFLDKLNNNDKLVQTNNLMFWVSLGLFIFYNVFPIIYLIGFLQYETWATYNLLTVLRIGIILMYTIFIVGFVKGKRRSFS